jgi:octaheme c-type cytochrome (tetrathionate reductase family)
MPRNSALGIAAVVVGLAAVIAAGHLLKANSPEPPLEALKRRYAAKQVQSVEHAKLAALQQPFTSPRDVTTACLSCHTERGNEVMASSHWNWSRREYVPGRGIRRIGKKNILNNFCIGVSSNLAGCDKCHAGFGLVDARFDFRDVRNVDCLGCHDQSNTYVRTGGGVPDPAVDLRRVAQSVGRPTRANCGTCHLYGGGGNNVKHGDLEEALFDPPRELDVHMASDGANLQCVDCHTATNHRMLGKLYSISSMNRDRSTCERCHTSIAHESDVLNEHTLKVACQTCHIPAFARVNATKMTWDWSTAGALRNAAPFEEKDAAGNIVYASIKGTFAWATNVVPDYVWFNGTAGHYLMGDAAAPDAPIPLNTLFGSYDDPDARIVPVKTHRAKQIYDPVTRMLIQPQLFAAAKGEGAFWRDFDWQRAAENGMRSVGLPYSGRYAFVETRMTWPVNHMVAPKEQALTCTQCHTRDHSRLAAVEGLYLPGRDRNWLVELLGRGAVLTAIAAVLVHGAGRASRSRKRGGR